MRTATFESTVDILVKAYMNDTLVHGNCYACAVGNIIAHNMGRKFEPCLDDKNKYIVWNGLNGRYCNNMKDGDWFNAVSGFAREWANYEEIEASGYSELDIVKIEHAFERADRGFDANEWMFNGLMAVVDVLAEIHSVDLSIKENAKLLFVKSPN